MVARYLPPAQYYPFISALLANQDRWAFARGINTTDEIWKLAALAGMGRATFDQAVADNDLRSWILQQQQADQDRWKIELDSELRDQRPEIRWRDELRRVPQSCCRAACRTRDTRVRTVANLKACLPLTSLLDLGVNMAILRQNPTIGSFGLPGVRGAGGRQPG